VIAVLLGLCLGGLARGTWPKVVPAAPEREAAQPEAKDCRVSEEIKRMAGVVPVTGEGIRIKVEDAAVNKWMDYPQDRLIVHERDLMLMVNELFSAGAVAVAINGERMVATTEIRCVGASIRINGRNTVPPYVIEAAGNPAVLKKAVLMMGGVVDMLAMEKLRVDIEELDELTIPAYGAENAARSSAGEERDQDD